MAIQFNGSGVSKNGQGIKFTKEENLSNNLLTIEPADFYKVRKEVWRKMTTQLVAKKSIVANIFGTQVMFDTTYRGTDDVNSAIAGAPITFGQTINLVFEGTAFTKAAKVLDHCTIGKEYDTKVAGQIAFVLGRKDEYNLKECKKCPDPVDCNEDVFDLKTMINNEVEAMNAFTLTYDWKVLTGTEFSDKKTPAKFLNENLEEVNADYLYTGARKIEEADITAPNTLLHMKGMVNHLLDELEQVNIDTTTHGTGTPGTANFKPDPFFKHRTRNYSDFVLLISRETKTRLDALYGTGAVMPWFQLAERTRLGVESTNGDIEVQAQRLGVWEDMFPVYQLPTYLMDGYDIALVDKKNIVSLLFCTYTGFLDQSGGKMIDPKFPHMNYYTKEWTWDFRRIDTKLGGNYTVLSKLPAHETSNTVIRTGVTDIAGDGISPASPSDQTNDIINAVMATLATMGDTTISKKATAYLEKVTEDNTEEPTE